VTIINANKRSIPTLPTVIDKRAVKWFWFNYPEALTSSEFTLPAGAVEMSTDEGASVSVDGATYANSYGVLVDFNDIKNGQHAITHRASYSDGEVDYTSINVIINAI
jgi:hypothetical protein